MNMLSFSWNVSEAAEPGQEKRVWERGKGEKGERGERGERITRIRTHDSYYHILPLSHTHTHNSRIFNLPASAALWPNAGTPIVLLMSIGDLEGMSCRIRVHLVVLVHAFSGSHVDKVLVHACQKSSYGSHFHNGFSLLH